VETANAAALIIHVFSTAAVTAVLLGAAHAFKVDPGELFQVTCNLADVSLAVRSYLLGKGEEKGANQCASNVVGGSVGVTVRKFELLNQRLQADRIITIPPAASVRGHNLRVDVSNNAVEPADLEVKIFTTQVLAIMSDGVAKDNNGMVVSFESFHALDGFVHEFAEILTSLLKGDESNFSEAVASGAFGSGVGSV
jgi:hypothetical protein